MCSLLRATGAPWIGGWGPYTWYMRPCPPNRTLESINVHMILLIFALLFSLIGGCWCSMNWRLGPLHLIHEALPSKLGPGEHQFSYDFTYICSTVFTAGAPWIVCWDPYTWYMKLCHPNWTLESINFHMVLFIFALQFSLLGAAGAPWIGSWGPYTWYMRPCPPNSTLESTNFHMVLLIFARMVSLLGAAGAPWIGCWSPYTWYMRLCHPNWTLESINVHMILFIFALQCSLLGAAGAPWIGSWGPYTWYMRLCPPDLALKGIKFHTILLAFALLVFAVGSCWCSMNLMLVPIHCMHEALPSILGPEPGAPKNLGLQPGTFPPKKSKTSP